MHVIDHFENYQTGGTGSGVLGPLLKQGETQSSGGIVAIVAVDEDVVQAAAAEMVVGIETDVPMLTRETEASDYSIFAAAAEGS